VGQFEQGSRGGKGKGWPVRHCVGKASRSRFAILRPMDGDLGYLDELIAAGQDFTYRRARAHYDDDPTFEYSKEKWIEWLTKAEMAVQTFAKPQSKALDLIKEARHLEIVGDIADDFYKSRELALSALRVVAREWQETPHSKAEKEAHLDEVLPEPSQERQNETGLPGSLPKANAELGFWDRYGRPIVVGVVVTVIGGLLLALLL